MTQPLFRIAQLAGLIAFENQQSTTEIASATFTKLRPGTLSITATTFPKKAEVLVKLRFM
jgi:hypothetical protein